jgi:hypothetical protein
MLLSIQEIGFQLGLQLKLQPSHLETSQAISKEQTCNPLRCTKVLAPYSHVGYIQARILPNPLVL